jgi:hypothetical protein
LALLLSDRCFLFLDLRIVYPDLLAADIGLLGRSPEYADLFMRQIAHSAFRKVAQREPAGLDPFESDHGVSHVVEHAAHLPLPSFVDRDLEPGIGLFLPDLFYLCRRGLPVLQKDACFERRDRAVLEHTLDLCKVGLGEFMLGMRDQVGKIPVIRQQQKPLGIVVQPSDRIDPDLDPFEQVLHRGPPLRIGHGRHVTCRFVQHDVGRRLFGVDELAVNLDMVLGRVGLGPELGHHLAVHPHPALGYKLFRSAARGDPRS